MKIGLVSDAHGNPFGLEQCLQYLAEVERVDQLYFLGDAVGYMSGWNEVVALLKKYEVTCLMGNHDAMLLGELTIDAKKDEAYRLKVNRDSFKPEHFEFMKSWVHSLELELYGRKVLLVHGSPWQQLTEYIYPDTDLSRFESLPYDFIITAHTHRPFIAQAGNIVVANAGSCGMPRDQGDLAACLVYDSASGKLNIKRLKMDKSKILNSFSGELHPMVEECLHREAKQNINGELING